MSDYEPKTPVTYTRLPREGDRQWVAAGTWTEQQMREAVARVRERRG